MEQNFAPEKCLVAKMPVQEMLELHLYVLMMMISQGLQNFRKSFDFAKIGAFFQEHEHVLIRNFIYYNDFLTIIISI